MPRLAPRLFTAARQQHPCLALLLRATRDVDSAANELRWLREHVVLTARRNGDSVNERNLARKLRTLCIERARGKPLQYLLGSEFFGPLELRVRSGVLIPRPETAQIVGHLGALLKDSRKRPLKVLDLCTGTGCIPLLLAHELRSVHALGVDISPKAIDLARHNQRTVTGAGYVEFALTDVLGSDHSVAPHLYDLLRQREATQWDVVTSNPPYISPSAYARTTARSVRGFEPRLALVPPSPTSEMEKGIDPGDVFYPRILQIAREVKAKVLLVEVADIEQAIRVARLALEQNVWQEVEIWRDEPSVKHSTDYMSIDGVDVQVTGRGHGRAVVCWSEKAGKRFC